MPINELGTGGSDISFSKQYLRVSADGYEDFVTIQNAIDSISDNSINKQYVINISPGEYNENITLKNYVSLYGKDSESTIINGTIDIEANSEGVSLYDLKISNTFTSDGILVDFSNTGGGANTLCRIRRCTLQAVVNTVGVKAQLVKTDANLGIFTNLLYVYQKLDGGAVAGDTNLVEYSGTGTYIDVEINSSINLNQSSGNVYLFNTTGNATNMILSTVFMDAECPNAGYSGEVVGSKYTGAGNYQVIGTNFELTGAGSGTGTVIEADSGSTIVECSSGSLFVSGFATNNDANAVQIGDQVNISFISVKEGNTNAGSGDVKRVVRTNGDFKVNTDIIDENIPLNNATNNSLQDLFNISFSAGWDSGFDITDNGDGTVDIASGTGVIRTANTESSPLRTFDITVPVTISTLADNDNNYVYVDYNSGAPNIQVTQTSGTVLDNENDKFELYEIYREGTTLHITDHRQRAKNTQSLVQRYLHEKFALNRTKGVILNESADTNRFVVTTSGEFYLKLNTITISAIDTSGADQFDRYYSDGVGGFTKTTGNTTWDNTQFDDGSGVLATLNNNRYSFQDFYMGADSSLVSVYATAQYWALATAEEAPLVPIPDRLEKNAIYIGRISFRKNDTIAKSVLSPFTGQEIRSTAVTNHGNLAGLSDDDHEQYALLSGRSTGQTLIGGTDASDTLELQSTSNATRGNVVINDNIEILNKGTGLNPLLSSSSTDRDLSLTGNLVVSGDFTAGGTTTFIDTTTLQVEDKNIELGMVTTPTDVTADGGGITLLGDTNKTIIWDNTNENWTFSEHVNIPTGKSYKINNVDINTGGTLANVAYLDQENIFTGGKQEIQGGQLLVDYDGSSSAIGWANSTFNNNSGNFKLAINAGAGFDAQINLLEAGTNRWQLYNDSSDSNKLNLLSAGGGTVFSVEQATALATFNTAIIINNDNNDRDTVIKGLTDSNLLYVDSGNNSVGIGTNSPQEKLHVSQDGGGNDSGQFVKITDTNTDNSVGPNSIVIGADNHYATNAGMTIIGSSSLSLGVGDGSDLANQRDLTILSNGYVGIGATTPTKLLELDGGSSAAQILIGNATDLNPRILFRDGSYAKGGIFFDRTATFDRGNLVFCNNGTGDNSEVSIADAIMTLTDSGHVGIGTSNPSTNLEISDSSSAQILFKNDTHSSYIEQNNDGGALFFNDSSGTARIELRAYGNCRFLSATSAENFKITTTGGIYADQLGDQSGGSDLRWDSSNGQIFWDSSSRRYKENIEDFDDSSWIYNLKLKKYNKKSRKGENLGEEIGFIAEDIKNEVDKYNIPKIVFYRNNKVEGYNKSDLVPFCINELKRNKEQIDNLVDELKRNKEQIDILFNETTNIRSELDVLTRYDTSNK